MDNVPQLKDLISDAKAKFPKSPHVYPKNVETTMKAVMARDISKILELFEILSHLRRLPPGTNKDYRTWQSYLHKTDEAGITTKVGQSNLITYADIIPNNDGTLTYIIDTNMCFNKIKSNSCFVTNMEITVHVPFQNEIEMHVFETDCSILTRWDFQTKLTKNDKGLYTAKLPGFHVMESNCPNRLKLIFTAKIPKHLPINVLLTYDYVFLRAKLAEIVSDILQRFKCERLTDTIVIKTIPKEKNPRIEMYSAHDIKNQKKILENESGYVYKFIHTCKKQTDEEYLEFLSDVTRKHRKFIQDLDMEEEKLKDEKMSEKKKLEKDEKISERKMLEGEKFEKKLMRFDDHVDMDRKNGLMRSLDRSFWTMSKIDEIIFNAIEMVQYLDCEDQEIIIRKNRSIWNTSSTMKEDIIDSIIKQQTVEDNANGGIELQNSKPIVITDVDDDSDFTEDELINGVSKIVRKTRMTEIKIERFFEITMEYIVNDSYFEEKGVTIGVVADRMNFLLSKYNVDESYDFRYLKRKIISKIFDISGKTKRVQMVKSPHVSWNEEVCDIMYSESFGDDLNIKDPDDIIYTFYCD